jgi:hypothetical protein
MARGRKTGGRKAGTPNQVTATLRDMILEALSNSGGVAYLTRQAEDNPTAFLALIGKILPMQVSNEGDGSVTVIFHSGVPRRQSDG